MSNRTIQTFDFSTEIHEETWLACAKIPVHFIDYDGEQEMLVIYVENGKNITETLTPLNNWVQNYSWYEKDKQKTPYDLVTALEYVESENQITVTDVYLIRLTFSVKFQRGNVLLDEKIVDYNKTVTPREDLARFTWYTDTSFTNQFDFDTLITEDTTLYLNITHTVHFCKNTNHDSEIIGLSQDVNDNEKATKPTEEYSNWEWYEEGTDFSEFDFDTTPITHETWLIHLGQIHIVTFCQNDGTKITTKTVPHNETVTPPYGYENVSWCLNNTPFVFSTPITQDITLKICNEVVKYKVHFCEDTYLEDIEGISPIEVEDGKKASKPTKAPYNDWIWYEYSSGLEATFPYVITKETWFVKLIKYTVNWIDTDEIIPLEPITFTVNWINNDEMI